MVHPPRRSVLALTDQKPAGQSAVVVSPPREPKILGGVRRRQGRGRPAAVFGSANGLINLDAIVQHLFLSKRRVLVMNADASGSRLRQGFASVSPERRREIASMGGKNVPNSKRSFSKSPSLAAAAGQKGGAAVSPDNRTFSRFPELAREAGRKGGLAGKGKSRSSD